MNELIDRIYETRTVVGKNGDRHKLKAAIDPREGRFLYDTIHNDDGIINTLEVGCAYGLSSLHICAALKERPNASHIIIDPCQNDIFDGVGIRNLNESGINFFELLEMKSEIALPALLEEKEGTVDLIFVDGWHTFDHTLLDCFYATRLLRQGGYLIVDDVSIPGVERVIDYLKNYPCYEECGSLSFNKPKSLKRNILKTLLSPLPQRTFQTLLTPRTYRRIFEDQSLSMVALKKVKQDERTWNWHNDSF